MDTLTSLGHELMAHANPDKARFFPKFFKTQAGEYGEGDQFLGITVPDCRTIARRHSHMKLVDIQTLLHSRWHEERLTALLILVRRFKKANDMERREIYELYLQNTAYINNWDLVDLSSRDIIGAYIYDHPENVPMLDRLSESTRIWDRRISIISTYYFLQKGDPEPTLRIANKLLTDTHDLIHKAVGWMLRELGKRIDEQLLIDFLKDHYAKMPRTTLRYAIERFSPALRRKFLAGNFD